MKKNIRDFLKYLEKETPITVDLSTISPTIKTVNSINYPIYVNVLGINEGTLGLAIISCGCKNCKNIAGLEVLYGKNGGHVLDAELVKQQIKSAIPAMPVQIRNVDEE